MVKTAEMGARKAGEKASGFAVTCSLLSQYLKERGSLGDLGLSISAATAPPFPEARGKLEVPRTMNLLPGVEGGEGDVDGAAVSGGAASDRSMDPALSMDLFSQRADLAPSNEKKPGVVREAQRGQMTVFYGGKVVVFNNFPADKAKELMAMAGRGCPAPVQRSKAEQPASVLPHSPSCPSPARHSPANATAAAPASKSEANPATAPATAAAPTPTAAAQDARLKLTQLAATDLPIARRASLHRFLEKRRDRINAKAPYPVSGSPASFSSSPAKAEETRQWLGLSPHESKK